MAYICDTNNIKNPPNNSFLQYLLNETMKLKPSVNIDSSKTINSSKNDRYASKICGRGSSQLWSKKTNCNSENIAVIPKYISTQNKIYYTTYYSIYQDSGIYFYDIDKDEHKCVKLYKDIANIKYYPKYYASCNCFIETQKTVYFVGGDEPYDGLMAYDICKDKVEKMRFDRHIGCNPALVCTNNDINYNTLVSGFVRLEEFKHNIFVPVAIVRTITLFCGNFDLHIIGGEHNNEHFCWNIKTRELELVATFKEYESGIRGQTLIYSKQTNKMYMLGGCNQHSIHYKDVWSFDFDTVWIKHKEWELPTVMCGCGAVMYDHRLIIIFGGRSAYSNPLDDILYLDISKLDSTWIKIDVKCPSRGCCNAVLVKDELFVHLLPFGNHCDHTSISVRALLPKSLLKKDHRR